MSKPNVCYFYDQNIGTFHYAGNHPMKPFRIRMTDSLVINYGLYNKLQVHRPSPCTFEQMTKFHTDDYIQFLQRVTPDSPLLSKRISDRKFNFGDDCPPFEGIYDFSALSAGGSIEGAQRLAEGDAEIAINWGGGLHHAKKTEASGFCYVNDIVLAILELLKTFPRVLYLDVDVHHGDGVEEAFYTTDRVMTVSFHLFGNGFFPGTGDIHDIGVGPGKNYAVNVPLSYGIDDATYHAVFEPVVARVMGWYRPSVVVLQLGADSVAGDKLGMFNVSMKGHGRCVAFLKRFGVPLLMLGGGGYTIRNVARVWTYETALAVDTELPLALPYNEFMSYYGPEYLLDVPATNIPNTNTPAQLQRILRTVAENLRGMPFAPSVAMHDVPTDPVRLTREARRERESQSHEDAPDVRMSASYRDRRVARTDEYSDSEDEEGDHRRQRYSYQQHAPSAYDTKPLERVPSSTSMHDESICADDRVF